MMTDQMVLDLTKAITLQQEQLKLLKEMLDLQTKEILALKNASRLQKLIQN